GEDSYAVIDSLIICKFSRGVYKSEEELARLYRLVTGLQMNGKDLIKAGERIYNVGKLINIRHGWKREHDYPPWRATHEKLPDGPAAGAVIKMAEYDAALDSYYRARDWDKQGIPSREKLSELGIAGERMLKSSWV
ncbi:TPA: aldehyde:ferredoxin oxidoreductase, partial [Candidatus Woesearchaeota archaeon]|nr:aldehyde:ferredoxin oxidoreductase [Candidatus Woesearchaeota archaeon]